MIKTNMNAYFVELKECLDTIKDMCLNINEFSPTEYEYIMNDDITLSDKVEKIADELEKKLQHLRYATKFMVVDDVKSFNMVDDVKDIIKVSIWTLEKALIDGAYDTFLDDGEKLWKFIVKEIRMSDDDVREKFNL